MRANDLEKMRVASSWLTTLPLKSQSLNLNKREFYDAFSLRYRWTPKYLPSTCPCGKKFDVDHAMSCMKGGFVHRRHDDVRFWLRGQRAFFDVRVFNPFAKSDLTET